MRQIDLATVNDLGEMYLAPHEHREESEIFGSDHPFSVSHPKNERNVVLEFRCTLGSRRSVVARSVVSLAAAASFSYSSHSSQ